MDHKYERKIKRNRIRRIRQLRRRLLCGILTIISIITISLLFFSIQAKAESKDAKHIYKYYKSVVVTSDDSLWNFAVNNSYTDDYDEYISEVLRMNNLTDSKLNVGMNLVIPYYSEEFSL